jgi:Cu2+-exporting ATPase
MTHAGVDMPIGSPVGSPISGGGCCPAPAVTIPGPQSVDPAFITRTGEATGHVDFLVPDMHCAACLARVERAVAGVEGVTSARANLTSHRLGADIVLADDMPGGGIADRIVAALEGAGYTAKPFDIAAFDAAASDDTGKELARAMAVAGFAAGNIMLLSVSIWSGAEASTRDLFHWISALIGLPAIAYAGRPFFRSALRALGARTLNMDVPISLAVLLAAAMSLYETMTGGEHAWFDASVGLLFFLLVGRFFDHRMRGVARSAAAQLLSLSAHSATLIGEDGSQALVPLANVLPGATILVASGERIPLDGMVVAGNSDVDRAMLTGEPVPEPAGPGTDVFAGTVNMTGPLTVRVTAQASDTLLADIIRLTEAAERSSGRFIQLADRAAQIYAPAVHLLSAATFLGWIALGAGWHAALTAAVAVLIITCPCALGLAVPAVRVVASGLLMRNGILLKDGAALEKLAEIDTVIFDKTGTLTVGAPRFVSVEQADEEAWQIAAALAETSHHPLAQALNGEAVRRGVKPATMTDIIEKPGLGMEGRIGGRLVRLGRPGWVAEYDGRDRNGEPDKGDAEIGLRSGDDGRLVVFRFSDQLRREAPASIAALSNAGLAVSLLSGDNEAAAARIADEAGISDWQADCLPADKTGIVADHQETGGKVLMVGDGINDAPALASAFVSMSPASGSDISQAAADIVFTSNDLAAVPFAWRMARAARRIVLLNFTLAVGYNVIAVPLAVFGFATPLIAAVAMSSSSILVTTNAVRLNWIMRRREASGRAEIRFHEAAV